MPWWGLLIILVVSIGIAYCIYRVLKSKNDGSVAHTGNLTFSGWMMLIGLSYFILYIIAMRIIAVVGG